MTSPVSSAFRRRSRPGRNDSDMDGPGSREGLGRLAGEGPYPQSTRTRIFGSGRRPLSGRHGSITSAANHRTDVGLSPSNGRCRRNSAASGWPLVAGWMHGSCNRRRRNDPRGGRNSDRRWKKAEYSRPTAERTLNASSTAPMRFRAGVRLSNDARIGSLLLCQRGGFVIGQHGPLPASGVRAIPTARVVRMTDRASIFGAGLRVLDFDLP